MDTQVAELEKGTGPASPKMEALQPVASGPNPKVRKAIVAAAILLALAGAALYLYYRGRVSTDDAEVDGHIVPMASKVYGTVAEVLFKENQQVEAGQSLVRIDPRDYQVKVDQARAALAAAESNARAAEVGVPWTNETTLSGSSDAAASLAGARAN
ncbi:MAG TPA: biotin/lipoyl-binding protein, partial [Terriglobia bacterium]|nr:biotin/lipoyl-binding protein [Terriglobia bacterium]